MRGELVAIDLETTGLDPMDAKIIEVGAVRIKDGEIIDEYETMVDPAIQIPQHVTHITGIQQDDVKGAPKIQKVLPEIQAFIGDAPIIAHNATLDMGMLQDKHHIVQGNTRIDTYELASVLMPNAPRYNLNSLTQEAGIELENAHRALDDARATALLYWALWARAKTLPHQTLTEIVRAASHITGSHPWDAAAVFEAALRESTTASFDESQLLFPSLNHDEAHPPLAPLGKITPVDETTITATFGEDGTLSAKLPGYVPRSGQVEMATIIGNAFNNRTHQMIEAGTGIGKSLAYLVPAMLWATQNNQRVVISTNTINLQEQLLHKDLPAISEALGLDIRTAVLKGRSNYLSPDRLETMRRRGPASTVELRTYAKILVWLLENQSGNRNEINLRGPGENNVWDQLSSEYDPATNTDTNTPFNIARREAENAHILIVNHALLVSDALSQSKVLPDYQYAIIDEAHNLEDAITRGLQQNLDQQILLRRLDNLGDLKRGLLAEILRTINAHGTPKDQKRFQQFIAGIGEASALMKVHIKAFFKKLLTFLGDIRNIRSTDFMTLVRITSEHRRKPSFADVQDAWKTMNEFFDVISGAMSQLNKGLNKLAEKSLPNMDALARNAAGMGKQLDDIRLHLTQFTNTPDDNTIYWLRLGQGMETPVLQSAPLHVGPMLEEHIWNKKESVILTSATLRTDGSFKLIKERLYADAVATTDIKSPFNYRESTLLYLPADIPEPADRTGYQRSVEKAIIELADALGGRVLVLFTSFTQLRQTSQNITPRLALGNITVFDQSDGTSREALVEGFKSTERAVLMGTRSFWEGIDIPGESLSALVITRLPFPVPSDPIFSARSDTYNNGFSQFALPDAILRFRQGFGRLIRSTSDRGIVTVMDSRIITKGYGTNFLESLPDCEMRDGKLEDLPRVAKDWLARK